MVDSYSSREGTGSQLADELRRLDGRPYPAYKDLIGSWNMGDFTLLLDKAQSDPYAPPSHFRVRVPQSVAKFPAAAYNSKIRNVALCDYLTRQLCQAVSAGGLDNAAENRGWHGSKGGDVRVETPGQHVIQRSAVVVNDQFVEARCTIALPAQGRSIEGHKAAQTLTQYLPHVVAKSLLYAALNASHLHAFLDSIEDQEHLRQSLADHDLVAFVADGSVLPRRSGADDQPMKPSEENHLQVFQSPPSMQLTMHVPHRGAIRGMGIRKGITLICGGGFHGKSTLLEALQVGIYNHIPGDGREFVAVDPNAVKIRAEDGRSVHLVDISPFINNLPFEKDTTRFNSEDASGSTSQAANIMEALEIGATTLLVDEDTCATNFMIRDRRMQQLVGKSREPITAFIYKVKPLLTQHNVSTIMVVGGSGDFFEVADTVILMDKYRPYDVTQEAKQITVDIPVPYQSDEVQTATATQHHAFGSIGHRIIDSNNFQSHSHPQTHKRTPPQHSPVCSHLSSPPPPCPHHSFIHFCSQWEGVSSFAACHRLRRHRHRAQRRGAAGGDRPGQSHRRRNAEDGRGPGAAGSHPGRPAECP